MGQEILIDTNVIIDYLSNQLPSASASLIDKLPVTISVVTRIELLGWYNATPSQLEKIHYFVDDAYVYGLTEEIIQQTIVLRQQYKIKLPDAIIAATAIVHDHELLTRNTDDFKGIANLSCINPWL